MKKIYSLLALFIMMISISVMPAFGQSKQFSPLVKCVDKHRTTTKASDLSPKEVLRRASTSNWYSLGKATFTDNFLFDNSYSVELQQYRPNPQWFRLVQPYNQGYSAENWNSNGTPDSDLQFLLMHKGDSWEVYKDTSWVEEPLEHDSLVWFSKRCTGYYNEWSVDDTTTVAGQINISHPGWWARWSHQDSILHNRVLSYQESGYPDVIQLAPRYYVPDLGGWNYTQRDSVVFIKFPEIYVSIDETQMVYVTPNSNTGISNANYTALLSDGTVLGFNLYYDYYGSYYYAYFCGAVTSSTSVAVPEKVSYNGIEYNVQYFGYSSGNTIDFDEAPNVTSITLPSTITYIYNYIPSFITELHLLGTTPPRIYSSGYITSSTTVYVPKSAYRIYQNYCNNGNNGWNTSIDLKVEGWEPQSYTVTVNTAGTLANQLLAVVEQWTDVDELTIIGHLNSEDMKIFSRMTQLRKLDLSQTDITSIGGCASLSKLEIVLLPSTVTVVEDAAFSSCTKLKSIDLTNVQSIGSSAFSGTGITSLSLNKVKEIGSAAFANTRLSTVSLPNVTTIGSSSFSQCNQLSSISMPKVTAIGSRAFYRCYQLKSVDLHSVVNLGSEVFDMGYSYDEEYGLVSVILSDDLEEIPYHCFYGCYSLHELNFPKSLKTIANDAIPYMSSDVIIPEGVTYIGGGNFFNSSSITIPSTVLSVGSSNHNSSRLGGSSLKDVYCYIVNPLQSPCFEDSYMGQATLHVPAFSVAAYKLDDNWYKFGSIVAMEGTIDKLNISTDFTIVDYTGLADKVDLTMTNGAHLTVSAGSAFNLGTFTQSQSASANSGEYYYDNWGNLVYYGGCSTLITSNEMKADDINLRLQVQTNRWNFISLPFDVNVSDIEYPEGTLWVIRKYSGADRAALTGNTWQNMTNGMMLQAGEGYILHCANESTSTVEFVFHPVNNAKKNNIFAYQDVVRPLNTYASEHAHNRSWNLVGNPYPSFFDTRSIEHNGVITVYQSSYDSWSGSYGSYTAYSLLDDDYVLRPNEAFFVQCPIDATSMTFKVEGRTHEYNNNNGNGTTRAPRRVSASNSNRHVYNFTLTNGEFTDKTRLVINPDAKMDYEISCDASKFMSDNSSVPQLYVFDNGIRYAIDERPLGDGIISLGARFGQTGDYTIQLKNNPAEDVSIMLADAETGKQVNLAEEAYTFAAQA